MNFIPNTEKEQKEMLSSIGVKTVDDLFSVIPELSQITKLDLPEGLSEHELVNKTEILSKRNSSLKDFTCFCGAGIYEHFIPSLVDEIINRSEFATAYTPYQPEASQGTLQAIFEYQSLITDITGLDVANASLYDGASAAAEAVMLAIRVTGRNKVLVSSAIHPEYLQVIKTYTQGIDIEINTVPLEKCNTSLTDLQKLVNNEVAAVVMQNPNFLGTIEDLSAFKKVINDFGCKFITIVNPVSLGVLQSPYECGADIAVGEGQVLGNSSGLGGITFGFMACKKEFAWKMPGRIVGQTVDTAGRRGFVLTLQSREQHIRREKATSNICTNSALNALAGCVYLAGWGPEGIKKLGEVNIQKSRYAYEKLSKIPGFAPAFPDQIFFNEFVLKTTKNIDSIQKKLIEEKIVGPFELGFFYKNMKDCLLFCVTEVRTMQEIDKLSQILASI